MKHYFVYMITHLDSGKVYVGRKTGSLKDYEVYYGNSSDALFSSDLIKENLDSYSKITLCEAKSAADLSTLEEYHILDSKKEYGTKCVNKHANGKWSTGGMKLTKAHCKLIGASASKRSGSKNGMFGRQHSEETKSKMRAKKSKENNPMWGRKLSKEHKEALNKATKARWAEFRKRKQDTD